MTTTALMPAMYGYITYNGTSWNQLGSDIDGEAAGDFSGESVSMNAAGERVAIGAIRNNGNGYRSGHVRVYQLIPTNEINIVTGNIFTDFNTNSLFDLGEPSFADGNILTGGDSIYYINLNSAGAYAVYCDTGTYAAFFKPELCIRIKKRRAKTLNL